MLVSGLSANSRNHSILGHSTPFETASKADQFIRRLKPYKGGNTCFWTISELDNLDKRNAIVPVLMGKAQIQLRIGLPFFSVPLSGGMALGGVAEGHEPFGFHRGFGVPEGAELFTVKDGCEFYRSANLPLVEDVGFVAQVTFGKTTVTNNEPIGATLESLIQLVDRVINIVEHRFL